MTTFAAGPQVLRAGIALIDARTAVVQRVITLQYTPDSLSRTLQPQMMTQSGDRTEALRLKAPPIETLKLEAELDATDQLEFPDRNALTTEVGLLAQLAALETIVYPQSAVLQANDALLAAGTLEIAPMEAPLALFIWSRSRILPVQITEFSVTEEAFDTNLHPIRAKVSLGLRVLSVNDLGFQHKGGSLFMNYLRAKEQLATRAVGGSLGDLGVGQLP
jgi:hypothetical protein